MKHPSFAPLLATALVLGAAAPAGAQTAPSRVEVTGQTLHQLPLQAQRALQGEYTLSDGRVLAVGRSGRQLHATLDGSAVEPLWATAPGMLSSADGRLTLQFTARGNGLVDRVVVRLRPGAPASDAAAGAPRA